MAIILDPAAVYSMVRNYLLFSKVPDRPNQIGPQLSRLLPEAIIGRQSIPVSVPGAIAHRFQISSIQNPLEALVVRFKTACTTISTAIKRPVTFENITGGVVAHYATTGSSRDRLTIDVAFKHDRGLLELVYKVAAQTPVPPPIVINNSGTVTV